MKREKFAPSDVCAIDKRALGEFFSAAGGQDTGLRDGVAIVNVRGPLMHHCESFFDSYDAIKMRVQSALVQKPKAVVLSIDSPGGLVSGCFDTANEIAACCAAAGVPLYAYIDGQACSAAYALACVADVVVIPPSAEAGSIGCVAEMCSTAKIESAMGIDRRIITSGDRKADGNPGQPIADEAVAALTGKVMQLAGIFFDHVCSHRPMKIADLVAMQAGVVIGASAVPMLADYVMGEDEMLAAIAAGKFAAPTAAGTTENTMAEQKTGAKAEGDEEKKNPFAKAKESYRASLQAIADDDKADEKDRESAKAELAAMDEDEKPEASAEHEEPDGDEPKEKAIAAIVAKALAPVVQRLDAREASEAKAQAKAESEERARLIASRADFDAATQTMCSKLSLPDLREYVKTAEVRKPKTALARIAASTVVGGTRAAGQVDGSGGATGAGAAPLMRQSEGEARAMRIVMGTEAMPPHAVHISEDGNLTIGQLYQPKPSDFDQRRLERGVREP
jgi:ClpP class serine protease